MFGLGYHFPVKGHLVSFMGSLLRDPGFNFRSARLDSAVPVF